MSFLLRLVSLQGRARRTEWWLTCMGVGLLGGLVPLIVGLVFYGTATSDDPSFLLVELIVTLAASWVQFAVSVRRAHDLDRSGWPLALMMIVGLVGSFLLSFAGGPGGVSAWLGVATFFATGLVIVYLLIWLYFLVLLGFFPGTATANTYGNRVWTNLERRGYRRASRLDQDSV